MADPEPVPPGFVPQQRRGFWRASLYSVLTLLAFAMLVCVILSLLESTGFDLRVIGLAAGAAILPTALYGTLILWIDRNEPETWGLRALAFLWGAVIAVFIALVFNSSAYSIFALLSDADTGMILTAVIAAPLVEESAKGMLVLIVLVAMRKHIDGLLDGLILGALVGLGFAMTENIMYFGRAYHADGLSSVGALFVVRSVINGLGHAVWTSFTGAGIGWARARHGRGVLRVVVPVLGWTVAVLGHAIWNLGASVIIGLIAMALFWRPEWEALIVAGVIGGLPFSIPPLVIAYILIMFGREKEERVIREFLPIEVGLGTLTTEEMAEIANPDSRKESVRSAKRVGGKAAARQRRTFNVLATRLAFFHYHAIAGERPYLPEIRQAEQVRWQLSALRWTMANTPDSR